MKTLNDLLAHWDKLAMSARSVARELAIQECDNSSQMAWARAVEMCAAELRQFARNNSANTH